MKLEIYPVLKTYAKLHAARLHMPGHKGARRFRKNNFYGAYDITELDFSDALENPKSIIRKAQEDIAKIISTQQSDILTDGSTCGIYAMVKAVSDFGNKVIVQRNSHKSVFNICEILQIEPLVLPCGFSDDLPDLPKVEECEKLIVENKDVAAILLTSPDYYGRSIDLKPFKELTDRYGKLLLVDGAHGAHLKYFGGNYAGDYAHAWVDGVHKTLPALTQGALLNCNCEKLKAPIKRALVFYRTTSPSYPIMASVEFAVKFAAENRNIIDKFTSDVADFKSKLVKVKFLNVDDPLKLVIDCSSGAEELDEYLKSKRIYAEFTNARYMVFILSPFSYKRELKMLERALVNYKFGGAKKAVKAFSPLKKTEYIQARKSDAKWLELEKSAGKISAAAAGIFPPCYPLILPGEEITQEIIEALMCASCVFGVEDGKIKVLK